MPKSKNRKTGKKFQRMFEGKVVVPTKYDGRAVGMGSYMAGAVDGWCVRDENDKPIPLRQIGNLERVK